MTSQLQVITSPTAEDFARAINCEWQRALAGFLRIGMLLLEAKEILPHGEFGKMLEQIQFGERKAQQFMAIARNPILTNPTHESHLPACWTTLYLLTKLPHEVLPDMLFDGRITAETGRKEVEKIVADLNDQKLFKYGDVADAFKTLLRWAQRDRTPSDELICHLLNDETGLFNPVDDMPDILCWLVKVQRAAKSRG